MAAMAVKTESLHHATEGLILAKPRKFYRATIENSHWQLRSLISSPEANVVYYPSGNEVVLLNTRTREREVIAKLPFGPKCLVASKDWLCCGAEKGDYVVMSLKDRSASHGSSLERDADPDERLPVDFETARRATQRDNVLRRLSPGRLLIPDPIKVGTEIVNCITLWEPHEDMSELAYNIPVAVVANNDQTVSIIGLRDSEVLDELVMPDLVNRSLISPDGKTLVTICDDPFLYIHERREKESSKWQKFEARELKRYEWVLAGKIQLESQRQADKSDNRGSFAACFSSSGKYLAVATQYGFISVFDAECLTGPESLLVTFTSSRPGSSMHTHLAQRNGAVRSMEFSPAPYDLLVWTEHSGRVGIADVRTNFQSRQLIRINSHAEGTERVIVSDRTGDLPRASSLNLSSDLEARQLRQLTREMLDRYHTSVTNEELEVLQAHRMARRRRDAASAAREALAETSNRWNAWGDTRTSTTTGGSGSAGANSSEGPRAPSQRISTSGLPAPLREFMNTDRTTASFTNFINERNRENSERRAQVPQGPRRRSSMILAAAENLAERDTIFRTGTDAPSNLERLTLTARLDSLPPDLNPWAENHAYRSRFPADPPSIDRSARLRVELAAATDEEPRDFANRLRQPWGPFDDLAGATSMATGLHRSVDTMGCTWSTDGRILYVGAQDGIHEYHVNVLGRRMFPSLVMR